MRKIRQGGQLSASELRLQDFHGGTIHIRHGSSRTCRLASQFVLLLAVFGFFLWNLFLSINLTASVDDLSHTLPAELALAIERGLARAFLNASQIEEVGEVTKIGLEQTFAAVFDKVPQLVPLQQHSASQERQKLQTKIDALFLGKNQPYNPTLDGMLWHLSDYVPQWMKVYFDWHTAERKRLEEAIQQLRATNPSESDADIWDKLTNNDKTDGPFHFMVMQCIADLDRQCGGTADRLKIFVYWIQQAAEANRMLLIHWTSPALLEEFLVPPVGGIDWRLPEFMKAILYVKDHGLLFTGAKTYVRHPNVETTPTALLRLRVQSATGLAHYYDDRNETESRKRKVTLGEPDEAPFADVYHDVWRIFFRPSQGVEQRIHDVLRYPYVVKSPLQQSSQPEPLLRPGAYTAIHIRALHARKTVQPELAEEIAVNGLKCATTLRPGGPFYLASDHQYVIKATEDYLVSNNHFDTKVLVRIEDETADDPLHLAKATNLNERHPSEFYDTFVDLWILGMSRCLVYNMGGFGTLGLLIGYDSQCSVNQKTLQRGPKVKCADWIEPNKTHTAVVPLHDNAAQQLPPLFLDPMP